MELYIILSGIDGYRIRGTAVNSIIVLANSEEHAMSKAKQIVDEPSHEYLWKAELFSEFIKLQ